MTPFSTIAATATTTYRNPNPTLPAGLGDFEWIESYLVIHGISEASYRYAYLGWLVLVFALIVFGYLVRGRGVLWAYWSKWALRRRTWRKKSTLRAIQKSNKAHRQPSTLPSNAQIMSLICLIIVPILLSTVGPDYIAPDTKLWDLTHNLRRRSMPTSLLLPRDAQVPLKPPSFTIDKEWWTIADRTGVIAFALFPLVVLFALKAPPFAILAIPFVLQTHFDKLSRLHRWAGRMIWLITTVHVITWSVQLCKDKKEEQHMAWKYIWMHRNFVFGVIVSVTETRGWAVSLTFDFCCPHQAYVMLTLTNLLSVRPIRTNHYEAFYIAHIILVPLTLIFSALHRPPIWWWCWGPLFLWIAERSYRMVFFVYRNGLIGGPPKRPTAHNRTSSAGEDVVYGGGYGNTSSTGRGTTPRKIYEYAPVSGGMDTWEMGLKSPDSANGKRGFSPGHRKTESSQSALSGG